MTKINYKQLLAEVCKFANVLKSFGVKKGDRVAIYMPMVLELPIAMLACARIGAIHSVVFGGFSAEALRNRILDCDSKMLICVDGYYRSGRIIRSKDNADEALEKCPGVKDVIVVRRVGIQVKMAQGRDWWWHEEMQVGDVSRVPLLDGAYTYLSVGVLDEAAEQPPLLAWSTTIFGVGATLATAKGLAVTAGTVLLSRLLRDDLFSQ